MKTHSILPNRVVVRRRFTAIKKKHGNKFEITTKIYY